ncbi:hypothetical protein N8Z50_03045 [Flavobacteriaceae bacterium]|nr:hypothetical protein [Flavobacteriaceae bacterium]
MRHFSVFLFLFSVVSCTPITETNWPEVSIAKGEWGGISIYGGSEEDSVHSIITTSDGGYAMIGNTQSTDGDFSFKERGGSDFFVMKFNAVSTLQWVKTYGGSKDDRGYDIVELNTGGYALIGYSQSDDGDASLNLGQHDNWLLRIDAEGELLWEKSFGFLGHDHAYNIVATQDGGLFFNGFLDVSASNGAGQDGKQMHFNQRHGAGEFWCHKVDKNGDLVWRSYFGGSSNDRSYDAIETSNGDFVLVGASESQDVDISDPRGSYDAWIIKLNAAGDLLWERSFGGSGYDSAKAIIENRNGDYVILGQTYSADGDIENAFGSSDIFIAFFSKEGVLKSNKNIGGEGFETANAILERSNGTLVLVGHQAPNNLGSEDSFLANNIILVHTLANGSVMGSYNLLGNGLDIPYAINESKEGKIQVAGSTESTSGDFTISQGGKDIFLAIWH